MRQQLLEPLTRSPFGCAGQDVVEMMASLFVVREVPRGAEIFAEGEVDGKFFVVGEGRLKAYRNLAGGRSITVFNLAAGDFFGFVPLLDGGPYPVSVAATTRSRLYVLTRHNFEHALETVPQLCPALLRYTARRLRECLDQVAQLGRKGAVARTANALLGIAARGTKFSGGLEVVLGSSQAEFARLVDVTPENLSRALARLMQDGVIERIGPRNFRIVDPAALSRRAETVDAND